ncbi:glycogenin glucosyltransferase [Coemansia sp. RSA 2336]|nr:glycogenin glucosyltransferase [Coemansia sp. RSA 2336]
MTANIDRARVCFATLLTTDSYLHGALALAASLRETGTSHEIICLVADGQLSNLTLERLELAFDRVVNVPMLQSNDHDNLALLGRPDLGSTVTKIGIWSLVEYNRIAFLDADTLVLDSIDVLLDSATDKSVTGTDVAIGHDIRPNGGMQNPGLLAAAPDLGWPDCFNSGVFVAQPSLETHADDWGRADYTRRLPFTYNTTPTGFYSYAPAFARFAHSIKVVHFIGRHKPWKRSRASDGTVIQGDDSHDNNQPLFIEFVEKWWQVHDAHVSLWSSEKGPFDKAIALAPSRWYEVNDSHQAVACSNEANSNNVNNVSETAHLLDHAWVRNDIMPPEHNADGEIWGTFTPAEDFILYQGI